MSNTPVQEPPAQRLSSGSGQTLPSRPLQPISDPSPSKRVCFYKSGDYKFSGHRMVINARTFKTFDSLLDALSKKVPLPFGVRTITTPRGTHSVRGLDDLHDGGSYVCSDQKRVKPLNLDEVNRRQVPWNTTRPLSAARRQRRQGPQFGRSNAVNSRPAKVTERVAVRTPKRLVIIKNKDPSVKRTIVLHRRTAPTFDALLDYLSQILQFPVLKLYSTDGRRVDGLAALILCSGVVVAAGNEPFRLGNYSFHRTGHVAQTMYMETVEPSMLQPRALNNKSFSSGRGSRNFSLSSERYIVNQINKSRNGSMNNHMHQNEGSSETEVNPHHTPMETCGAGRVDTEHHACIAPQDDDIEKSFRVNQDGSMTVEMKVRLTIKEEEMLHWTTTLSRSSLSKRTVCASISESGNNSPNSNNAVAKDSSSVSEDETKVENHPTRDEKGVSFNNEQVYGDYTSTALGKAKSSFKRTPTPGPRYVKKKASVESVKMVTESGVQENTVGHYSYMERTANGESTEGYCVVRHNSSSNRPIPKPRKTASAGASNKGSHSSIRSSGVAEVLQIQNNGMEVTETVMHIYESQGCYDNFFANEEYSTDGVPLHDSPLVPDSKPSTEAGPRSSSNDIDFSWQPPTTDSLQRQEEEMLSLSSEPVSSAHNVINNLSPVTENEAQAATNSQTGKTVKKDKTHKSDKNSKMIKPARNHKSSPSTSSSDKKLKESIISPSKNRKHLSTDKHSSNASVGKKSLSSSESARNGQQTKGAENKAKKLQSQKSVKEKKTTRKEDPALLVSSDNLKRTLPKKQSTNKAAAKDNGHNVNTPTERHPMKKNMSDFLQPKKSPFPGRKTGTKPKSMTENRIPSPKQTLELNESVSMPSLNRTPSQIHQYVESWLEKVSPDQVPYTEETIPDESEPQTKVVFQIGGDSEMDENNECQSNLDEYYSQPGDAVKKSTSCLSVPLFNEGPATSLLPSEQKTRGLCVSMPTVRVDPVPQESRLRAHKSAEAIGLPDDESSSSNILNPKAKIKPVLRQLCSSIQCIRRVSDTKTTSSIEKSSSLPDFSTQVALVFGSSCKAFLSFLSVMTLRDSLTGSAVEDSNQSRSTSEAMLMMESLQKISAIEDEEEQKASLTDLQSRASSEFRERWKDFLILRERLESEPLSPRVSETEFALDVVSEGGDVFEDQHLGIDELMDELNMPEDLRAEISSTIQQSKSFYPAEESTFVETERNQSDSEEDVEKFVEDCNDETKQSPELGSTFTADSITEKEQGNDDGDVDDLDKMQSVYYGGPKTMWEQAGLDVKDSDISQRETDEPLNHKENESDDNQDQIEEDRKEENEDTKEINNVYGKENKNERQEERKEEAMKIDEGEKDEWESDESIEKVEEGTEEEITVDEKEDGETLVGENELFEETEEGKIDEEDRETRQGDSESDEREFAQETERGEEGGNEEMQEEETEEAIEVGEETDEEEERENIKDQEEDEKEVGAEDLRVAENDDKREEVIEGETVENMKEQDEREKEDKEEEAAEAIAEGDEVEENEEEMDVATEGDVQEEAEEVVDETEEEEEVQNMTDEVEENEEEVNVATEGDVQEEAEKVVDETEEEEEVQNMIDEVEENEEEVDVATEGDEQEEAEEVVDETEEEEEVQNMTDEVEENEEEVDFATEGDEQEEAEEVVDETEEEEEVQNMIDEVEENEEEVDVATEGDEQEEAEEVVDETEEEEDVQNMIDEVEENEEEVDVATEGDEQEEAEEVVDEMKEEEEVQNMTDEVEENEEEVDVATEGDEREEAEEVVDETEEEEEVQNMTAEVEENEEEVVAATERDVEEEAEIVVEETDEEKEVDKKEVGEEMFGIFEESDEEHKTGLVSEEEDENAEEWTVRLITDEKEDLEKTENSLEEEEDAEEMEIEGNKTDRQMLDEEERGDELKEGLDHVVKQESNDEVGEENVTEDADSFADCKNLQDAVSYLRQHVSSCEEANVGQITDSPTKYSSDVKCEDDKGNGTDSVNELETGEEGEHGEERHSSQPHPVEISQELLDFVNSALQSSSLIFTYDSRGNFRIEADSARVVQTKQIVIPKSSSDSLYGFNCLPSPRTSDLSDYRPETSESGGYKTQESVDIDSESGEEASKKPFPIHRRKTDIPSGRINVEEAKSRLSVASNSEVLDSSRLKSAETSYNSGSKASREDLSYFSAASSLRADVEVAPETTQYIPFTSEKDSADGVLIDQGRWLLKENHLIRKSPPISLGMYGHLDSTSIDTFQENTSEDSLPQYKTEHNPLAAISSSELEEMAKPQTPKCTYYNMPHGSDSDPFLDDSSIKSGKKDTSSVKGRGSRVSPTVDTSKTWANKNSSLSSFASVEFKLPDRKVHPEGESAAVTQTRRTSSGRGTALQAQDSLNSLRMRCGQYCPIL